MVNIVAATKNKGKIKEFKSMFSGIPVNILSLEDIGFEDEIIEDGKTFEENSIIKAKTIAAHTDNIVFSDDSGLIVPALGGKPGVYSARFAGDNADDLKNTEKLLSLMKTFPYNKRCAEFKCSITLVLKDKKIITMSGVCKGIITNNKRGENGFGYDPVFEITSAGKTFAEMTDNEKNKYSHRKKAFNKLIDILRRSNVF